MKKVCGEDFHLDLLFFHRKLKRLIALDLKLGRFKAQYKGQMELYLRWLEKYEMQPGEGTPLGLVISLDVKIRRGTASFQKEVKIRD